jgi:hypothetical protein
MPRSRSDRRARLLRAGLLTAVIDGLFASVQGVVQFDRTPARVFRGVAATLLGPEALEGGATTAWIGVAMHLAVAFAWSTVFLLLFERWARVRRLAAAPYGVLRVAALYGPFVYLVMSLVVIPLLLRRPPSFALGWWVQLIGHIPFVGVPIVGSIAPPRRGAA